MALLRALKHRIISNNHHFSDPSRLQNKNIAKNSIHFIFLIKSQLITGQGLTKTKHWERHTHMYYTLAYCTCIRTCENIITYVDILRIRRIVQRHQNKTIQLVRVWKCVCGFICGNSLNETQ